MPDPARHKPQRPNRRAEQTRNIQRQAVGANPIVNAAKVIKDKSKEIIGGVSSSPFTYFSGSSKPKEGKPKKEDKPSVSLPLIPNSKVPVVSDVVKDAGKKTQGNYRFALGNEDKIGEAYRFNGVDPRAGALNAVGYLKRKRNEKEAEDNPISIDFYQNVKNGNLNIGDQMSAQAAAYNIANNNVLNPDAERNLKVINDVLAGKYGYGVDQEEWEDWYKKAYKKTGDYLKNKDGSYQLDNNGNKIPEMILRPDAPPPPLGTDEANYKKWEESNTYLTEVQDEDGNWVEQRVLNWGADEVPVSNLDVKKYWDWYRAYNASLPVEQKKVEEKSYHMAGVDPEAADSLLDIVRDDIAGKKDFITGTYDYFQRYFWNPLKNHDWGTLGLNTLVNLGETMDAFGVGARAVLASQDALKYSSSHIFKGQNAFVYSGGDKKQKRLIELGADNLIKARAGTGGQGVADKDTIDAIKKAGLWDDYLVLEEEWNNHDNEGNAIDNLRKAYSSKEYYYAETGNLATNMLVEIVLDPSIVIGGTSKAIASTGSKTAAKTALEALRGIDDIYTKEFIDFINSGNKAVKVFTKNVGEGIITKNGASIKTSINNFADHLIKNGVIAKDTKEVFTGIVSEAIGDIKTTKQYRFIQSMHNVDTMINKVDSTLLKASFIVPYTPFKVVSSIRKTLRNNKKWAEYIHGNKGLKERQAMADFMDGLVTKDGRISIGNFDEAVKRMHESTVVQRDDRFSSSIVNSLVDDMKYYTSKLEQLTRQLTEGNYTPDHFDEVLNLYIRKVSDGKLNSLDDFVDSIDNIFHESSFSTKGELDRLKELLDNQIKSIDSAKKSSVETFKNTFYKDLSKAKSIEEFQELAIRYKRFYNFLNNPEQFESDLLKRVNEIIDDKEVLFDDLIRNYELKNKTVLSNPSDTITTILNNMDKTSKYLNELHPDVVKHVEAFQDFLEKNVNMLTGPDRRLLWDVLFKDDITPKVEYETVYDTKKVLSKKASSFKEWVKKNYPTVHVNTPEQLLSYLKNKVSRDQKFLEGYKTRRLNAEESYEWYDYSKRVELEKKYGTHENWLSEVKKKIDKEYVKLEEELAESEKALSDYEKALSEGHFNISEDELYEIVSTPRRRAVTKRDKYKRNVIAKREAKFQEFLLGKRVELEKVEDEITHIEDEIKSLESENKDFIQHSFESNAYNEHWDQVYHDFAESIKDKVNLLDDLDSRIVDRSHDLDLVEKLIPDFGAYKYVYETGKKVATAEDKANAQEFLNLIKHHKLHGHRAPAIIDFTKPKLRYRIEFGNVLTTVENSGARYVNVYKLENTRLDLIRELEKYDDGIEHHGVLAPVREKIINGLKEDIQEIDQILEKVNDRIPINSNFEDELKRLISSVDSSYDTILRSDPKVLSHIEEAEKIRYEVDVLKAERQALFDDLKNIAEGFMLDPSFRDLPFDYDSIEKLLKDRFLDVITSERESRVLERINAGRRYEDKIAELKKESNKAVQKKRTEYKRELSELQHNLVRLKDTLSRIEKGSASDLADGYSRKLYDLNKELVRCFDEEHRLLDEAKKLTIKELVPDKSVNGELKSKWVLSPKKGKSFEYKKNKEVRLKLKSKIEYLKGQVDKYETKLKNVDEEFEKRKLKVKEDIQKVEDRIDYLEKDIEKTREVVSNNSFIVRRGKAIPVEDFNKYLAEDIKYSQKAELHPDLQRLKDAESSLSKEEVKKSNEVLSMDSVTSRALADAKQRLKIAQIRANDITREINAERDRITNQLIDYSPVIKHARNSLDDINPRELYSKLEEAVREKYLKMASDNYNNGLYEQDMMLLKQYQDLMKVLEEQQLGVVFSKDMELLDLHCDLFNVFNKYVTDKRFTDIRFGIENSDVFRKLNKIIDVFDEWSDTYRDAGERIPDDLKEISETLASMRVDILNQLKILDAYDNLSVGLRRIPGLTDDQYWTVLDALFGFTKNNPKDFFVKASRNPERLIEKIELNSDTLRGRSRVSLDGFRYEARNINSELYKDYEKELMDNPELIDRIDNICQGGHLNPDKDVQVQMLQLILRDKDSIDYYNQLAKERAVLFTDIETEGRNSAVHEITDIAYKQWEPDVISSESSLEDILNFIESDNVMRLTSKRSFEDVDRISTSTLQALFKDRPNAGRAEMLEEYKKIYGTSDPSQIKTEQEVLLDFITKLDELHDVYGNQTPTLVTHSNRGFDMKYIRDRIYFYREQDIDLTPSHIVNIPALMDASQSTIERLKSLTNDPYLTSEQSSLIKDLVVSFSRDIGDLSSSFKILDMDVFDNFFNMQSKLDDMNLIEKIQSGIDGNVIKPSAIEEYNQLIKYLGSKEYDDLLSGFVGLSKDIHSETRMFNGNFLLDEVKGGSLFKAAYDLNPDTAIPEVGYDIVGSFRGERSVLNYFDIPTNEKVHVDVLVKTRAFVKEMDNILRYQIKQNTLVDKYYDDFVSLINYAKEYAQDLQVTDPFMYLKYLHAPETPYEAYVMAQLLWDKTLKYVDDSVIDKSTEVYKGMYAVPSNVRDYVLSFVISGKKFDLSRRLSGGALSILKGEFGQSTIYKYVEPEEFHPAITKPLESTKEFLELQSKMEEHLGAYTRYTMLSEEFINEPIDIAVKTAHETMVEIGDDLRYLEKHGFLGCFRSINKSLFSKRREMMTAQIMDYVIKSEDNLLSHLLFHNHQLHIPVKGNELHREQVDVLRKLVSGFDDSVPIVYKESNGYIHIGIKRDTKIRILNDSRFIDEKATIKLDGRDVVYSAPDYKVIHAEVPDNKFITREISKYIKMNNLETSLLGAEISSEGDTFVEVLSKMKEVHDQIDFLTEGKSVGSVGTLHTLSRQQQIYKNLPQDFLDDILTEEISCDARFWHQASFDMSCLGDSENMWKYTDYNDADPILSLYNTLTEVTGAASAERMYLGYWSHPDSPYRLSNMFEDVSDAEKINILKNMDDMVVVNFGRKDTTFFGGLKSSTGVEVSELQIRDLSDLKRAEASGAILVPYDLYLDMAEVFNKSELTDKWSAKVMKAWTKIVWLYKVGQLSNPGTWARNWIDATMKMTADVGSAGEAARFQLKAMHSLITYKTISRKIKGISELNYTSSVDIEREYYKLPEKYRRYMSYEEYKFIDDWLKVGISGGESRTMKSIAKYSQSSVNLNTALKNGDTSGILTEAKLNQLKQNYDLIGETLERFEDLDEAEILSLIRDSNTWLFNNMDKSRFMEIFRGGRSNITDDELIEYNRIANELIIDRFKRIRGDKKVSNIVNSIASHMLTPMSAVEEVVRLAEYMALDEQGFTHSQVFKSIVGSQFNYDNKVMRAKMMEMFIPYYGFMDANLHYWIRALEDNPRMLRYVEHIWGELSWDAAFQYGEDPEKNGSVNYMMSHGGIPIGKSGMYLKTDPSFIQPLNLMLGSPSEYVNALAAPFQFGIRTLLNNGATEYSSFFHEVTDMTKYKSVKEQAIEALPIVGTYNTRYWDHYKAEEKEWERLKGGNSIEEFLVKYSPSLFGAVQRYELDKAGSIVPFASGFQEYINGLEEKGLWWDQNLQKAVPISMKNTDGLNNPNLTFDETAEQMFLQFNKVWDANQNRFVDVGQYRPGGLNREFDLNKPEDWEELCRLKEKMLGQKWDYNKRKWVDKDEWEPIMLNDPDLSWDDNQRYHEELFGEKYDYNQGKYVQKDQYTEGGLNSEYGSLSFQELCALQYALHGKEYIKGKGFVKTREPLAHFDLPEFDPEKTLVLDRSDSQKKFLERLGIVTPVYAAVELESGSRFNKFEGRFVLNGNAEHDAKVFQDIINEFSDKAPGYGRYSRWKGSHWNRFRNGWGNFSDFPERPKSPKFTRAYPRVNRKKFSRPYTSGGEYAGLRMALYGTKIYEDYYNYEFNYNYSYRSPSAGPKKFYGSMYHSGQYLLRGQRNRSEGKWEYYRR